MRNKTLTTAAFSGLLFTASTLVMADEQQLDVTAIDGKAKVVWLDNGESRTWQLDGVDLSDPAALQQALSDLPAEKRDKLIALLTNNGPEKVHFIKLGDDDSKLVQNIVIELDDDTANGTEQHKVVKLHKIAGGTDFELLKSLLQNSELSAEQLQQLQVVLDAKH